MNLQHPESSFSTAATPIHYERRPESHDRPTSAFVEWLGEHRLMLHGSVGLLEAQLLRAIRSDRGFEILANPDSREWERLFPLAGEADGKDPCPVSFEDSEGCRNESQDSGDRHIDNPLRKRRTGRLKEDRIYEVLTERFEKAGDEEKKSWEAWQASGQGIEGAGWDLYLKNRAKVRRWRNLSKAIIFYIDGRAERRAA